MSGKKNIDRSLKKMARKHARDARTAMRNLLRNKEARCVKHDVVAIEAKLENLLSLMGEQCVHCGNKVEFGYNTCAGCADERGP